MGPEQIGLHPDHVAVATRVVKDRFDACLLLHHHGRGERAHAARGARTIGNVDQIDAVDPQVARLFDERLGAIAPRRHQFDAHDEGAARERVAHPGLL